MTSTPSYAQRQLRAEARRFVRLVGWRSWCQLLGVAAVVSITPLAIGTPGWLWGLLTGFVLTFFVAIVGLAFLLSGDATFLVAGILGESKTNEVLAAASKASVIWSAVPNVEAGGRDVDHLVLTPSGVVAIDTKWRFRGADGLWLKRSAQQAKAAAKLGGSVLRSKGIEHRTEVIPVVVVWGGARRELPEHQIVEGVAVVRGDYLPTWLMQCSRGKLAQDHAEALQAKLLSFVAAHAPSPRPAHCGPTQGRANATSVKQWRN